MQCWVAPRDVLLLPLHVDCTWASCLRPQSVERLCLDDRHFIIVVIVQIVYL